MDVNKIRIITLGNMKGDGDLMLKPASKNESEKIFMRKGSTTIFHKLADKLRGIQKAPVEVELAIRRISNNEAFENIKNKFTPSNPSIEAPYTNDSYYLKNPIIFVSNILNESQIDYIKHNSSFISKNNSSPNSSVARNNSGSSHTTNDVIPYAPTDEVGPPPPNYIPDPPSIKQIRISNLERAMDLGGMNFDKNNPNYEQLNRQKEIVETTIKQIAITSTLKKSERINEGRGSLSNLKLELKREFQNLMIMANKNGYQTENWIKRTADLNTILKKIDFIPGENSN
jgi:hypothetical protein